MNDYKIKELYEEMEKELISSMKRNFKRHLKEEGKTGFQYTQWQAEKLKELSRYRKQNKLIIGDYTNGIHKEVSKHIQEEVKQGSIRAIKQYNKALGKNLKPDKIMNESFFKTNDKKVDALIKVVNDDLKTANTSALRMINDQYRQVIHKSAFFVGNGVFTEQQAVRMATDELTELKKTELAIDESNKDFLAGGLNCIEYKNGRRVNIASYAQMAVRTANLRAQLMGEGDFRKAIGRVLVQATSHGGACPICQKWEKHIFIDDVYSDGTKEDGKYMLLSEAMEQGFLHPNCRHGLTTYYPELEGIENETDEEYQADLDYINERMNYCDRNIKKYDRLEHGSISKLNIQQFANKKKQWETMKSLTLSEKSDLEIDNLIGTIEIEPKIIDASNLVYKEFEKNNCENLLIVDKLGNSVGFISTSNKPSSIGYSLEQSKIVSKKGRKYFVIHNHPSNSTFSLEDIYEMIDKENICGIIVTTKDYNYFLEPIKKDLKEAKIYKKGFIKDFEERLGMFNDELFSKYPQYSNNQILHIAFSKYFKEIGWKYGRKRKN